MFFGIIIFLKISFLITGLSLHASFEKKNWIFNCENEIVISFPPPKWMGKQNGLIMSSNNIYDAQPIIIKIVS